MRRLNFTRLGFAKSAKKGILRKICLTFPNTAGTLSRAQNRHCLQFTLNVSFRSQNNRISIPEISAWKLYTYLARDIDEIF